MVHGCVMTGTFGLRRNAGRWTLLYDRLWRRDITSKSSPAPSTSSYTESAIPINSENMESIADVIKKDHPAQVFIFSALLRCCWNTRIIIIIIITATQQHL